jgi:hypothetical protein
MPTAEEKAAADALMREATINLLCAATKCCRTYAGKYKHYCTWVDAERAAGCIDADEDFT